ncbi:MAG: CRISPR-associated helicase Cas3' [Nitrososphaeria archaeon]
MISEEVEETKKLYRRYLDRKGKKLLDRPFIDRCLKELSNSDSLIISAPTGYGKSLVSLFATYLTLLGRSGWEKLVVAFPTRALINQQEEKFKGTFEDWKELIGLRHMGVTESRYFSKPVTITTYDTLSMTSFGLSPDDRVSANADDYFLPHYLFSRFSAMISNLVLDEAHLMYDSQKSLNYLLFLAYLYTKVLQRKFVLLSATLPDSFTEPLQEFGFKKLEMKKEDDEEFWSERLNKAYSTEIKKVKGKEEAVKFISDKLRENNYRRALVVLNTVEEAQEVYKSVGSADRVLLIHSRYTDEDKAKKVEKINSMKEGVVIGTQSVEVGIDSSFDLMITDAAPLNSLVQRFGRFLRDEGDEKGYAFILLDQEECGSKYKGIYDMGLVRKSVEALKERMNRGESVNLHVGYKDMLNQVYSDRIPMPYNQLSQMYRVFMDFSFEPLYELFWGLGGSFIRDEVLVDGVVNGPETIHVPVDMSFAEKHLEEIRCGEQVVSAKNDLTNYAIMGCSFVLRGVNYDSELGLTTKMV